MAAPNIEPQLKIKTFQQKILTKSVFLSHLAAQLLTNSTQPSKIIIKTFLRNISNLRVNIKNYVKSLKSLEQPESLGKQVKILGKKPEISGNPWNTAGNPC